MPTDQQIARIKARVNRYLTETAVIEKLQSGVDASNVPLNDSWSAVATDVPCRVIDPRSRMASKWMEVGQADAMVDMVRIVFAYGTEIDKDYRAIIGGRVYHVVEITDDRTDGVDVIVHAKRIRGNDDVS